MLNLQVLALKTQVWIRGRVGYSAKEDHLLQRDG